MRSPILWLAAVSLLLLSACATIQPESPEEDAITQALFAAEWLESKPDPFITLALTGSAQLLDCDTPGFFKWPLAGETNINLTIPVDVLRALPVVNRRPRRLNVTWRGIVITSFEQAVRAHVMEVSRPAISRNGDEAVIAVAFWGAPPEGCDGGWVAYFRKEDSKWTVRGYGCYWVT